MTVLAALRRPRATPTTEGEPGRPWLWPALGGAAAAATTLVSVLAAVGAIGSLAAHASLDWGDIFGIGSAFWLLTGGARLSVDHVGVALTPLLGFALLVGAAVLGARRSLPRTGPRRVPYLAFLGGYAALALLAVALSFAGPLHPRWWSLGVPLLGVPGLGMAIAEVRRGRLEDVAHRIPRTLRRCLRPAVRTSGVALAVGMAFVLAGVTVNYGRVEAVTTTLRPGFAGGTALILAQLLAGPNLGLWALGFLSGPGFSLSEGTSVSLGGATTGLLPQIPVLAAAPGPGRFPWYLSLLLLVPVALGMYAARHTLAEIPRLAGGRVKMVGVATTVALTGVLVAALDILGGGCLGQGKLRSLGVSAPALAVSLGGLMLFGAVLVVIRDWWRLRR